MSLGIGRLGHSGGEEASYSSLPPLYSLAGVLVVRSMGGIPCAMLSVGLSREEKS